MNKIVYWGLLLLVLTVSCRRGDDYRRLQGAVWNTAYSITYRGPAELTDSVTETLNRIDRSLSVFNPRSLVSAVNKGDTAVRADGLFSAVMAASREIWGASQGRFDPTLGPAIRLWGFGPGHDTLTVTPAMTDSVRALVGLDKVTIHPDGTISKSDPRVELNFSAIAKGLACDEVGEMLRRNGVTDYMVEIGGEIALSGVNPQGKPWRIMIDSPAAGPDSHKRLATVAATDCGIASSGNYRNFRVTESGGRVGHTIDPATCRPAQEHLLAVTVVAPSCMMADGLATACMASDTLGVRRLMASFPDAGCLMVLPDSTVRLIGKFPQLQ